MNKIEWAIVAVIVLIVVLILGINRREAQCMEYGYASANTTMFGTTYCIKRVNQTDVVVRLDSLQRAR